VIELDRPRRLTRGTLELRGKVWWNRYREEIVDVDTGVIARRAARMRVGSLSELRSQAAADKALDQYLALASSDTLTPGRTVTVREYCGLFDRRRVSGMRTESQRHYRGTQRRYIEPFFGARTLASIDVSAVEEFVVFLHKLKLSRATIAGVISQFLQMLRHARRAGYATHSIPRSAVKPPSDAPAPREPRHFTQAEIDQIIAGEKKPERRALWTLLALSGCRIGEGLGLPWFNVDLAAGVIRIHQGCVGGVIVKQELKTPRSKRIVPILPQLAAALTAYRMVHVSNPAQLLFASRTGRPRRADDIRRRWLKPHLARLQIPDAGCHAFRHFTPGMLDRIGLTPLAIQKWMGHESIEMTERYVHTRDEDLRAQTKRALADHPAKNRP
jgi:integrase